MLELISSESGKLPGASSSSDGTASRASVPEPFHRERRSEWWRSSVIICGEIMGTGVLSLPYACAQLGWALGIGASIFFGLTALFSGTLLSICRNEFYPDATSFADLARATVSPRFGRFTRGALVVSWAFILPYYLVACSHALDAAFPGALCYWQWSLVCTALMVPILQWRTFHGLSCISLLSTISIVLVVAVSVPSLIASAPPTAVTSVGVPAGRPFLHTYSSLGSFIFAYQGQSIMLEIMREMRDARDFPRALHAANGLMMAVYTGISAVGYASHGERVAGFLPDTMPAGPVRSAVGVLLAYHTMVSYLLTGQPLHRTVHLCLFPHTADAASGAAAAAHWALITLSFLAAAFLVANAIPFFAHFQDLLGNLIGASTVFGWPALFYLRACAIKGRAVPRARFYVCALFLCAFLPAFTLLGTVNSLLRIADDWQATSAIAPFGCAAQRARELVNRSVQ